jgi:hypothetical protein
MGIIKHAHIHLKTVCTGSTFDVDINTGDGVTQTSAFASKVSIANGAASKSGAIIPSGTYQYQCLAGASTTTLSASVISYDIDAVGSTIPGSDLTVHVRILFFKHPLESLAAV